MAQANQEHVSICLWKLNDFGYFTALLLFLHLKEIDGTIGEVNPTALILALADIIHVKDPSMLILDISGLVAKYPDIK